MHPTLPGLPPAPVDAEVVEAPAAQAPVSAELLPPSRDHGRMLPVEIATATMLVTRGKTIAEVADLMGRAPATIKANLKHGKDLLRVFVPEAIELWLEAARVAATKGKHEAARDLVYAAGAATQAPQQGQGGPVIQVAIGVTLPGLPVPPAPSRTDDGPDSD